MFTKEVFTIAVLVSLLWSGAMADCVFRGHKYPEGPIVTDNPCDHCYCPDSGIPACAIVDCFYLMTGKACDDGSAPVRKAGECCPTCPATETETV